MEKYLRKKRFFVAIIIVYLIMGLSEISVSDASFVYTEGIASWYGEASPGILPTTANMDKFNEKDMTCAVWDLAFGTKLEVTNIENGKTVIVRVNDRGPAKRLCKQGRIIDLTKGAFNKICDLGKGLTRVRVSIVE